MTVFQLIRMKSLLSIKTGFFHLKSSSFSDGPVIATLPCQLLCDSELIFHNERKYQNALKIVFREVWLMLLLFVLKHSL